ncbi:ABC transporter ATP-binding protein [Devosia sp. FKR38]|uniref:ABC transporter ATP-binding protein n=1 Tax=Devosia sp. FKR38 TaxID=2562312 RepID=UPI0010C09EFF|nr:ABC transporter ATP-binding protein [Devosia sp. FKR38]
MIDARAITVRRQGRSLIDGIDIMLRDGEMLGVVGPNGSGKTTLLRSLYGALQPDAGDILLDGVPMTQMSRRAVARRIAVVPQGQPLDGDQSVADLVGLGRLPHQAWFGGNRAGDRAAVEAALDRVALSALADQPLRHLSGGEVQRALIARALCQQASHLLLDEPTNHLDLGYQHDVLAFVRSLCLSTLVVLHDLNLAARYCDRIALLDHGRLLAIGAPAQVLTPERVSAIYRVPATAITTPSGRQHLVFADALSPEPLP